MKTAAIICEFNPFHNGHKYLINSVRENLNPDAVICIMSGNFVQRGKPAVFDKYERTKAALDNGADLIVQMPTFISLSSAKFFAKGGVSIAKALNCDYLCFGSTSGDLELLKSMALNGIDTIEDGNNILACEYIRNAEDDINLFTVKINESLGHASDIRANMDDSYMERLFDLLRYKITTDNLDSLRTAPEIEGGLEYKIIEVLSKAEDFDSFVKHIKSKRYNYTKISRILMQILLGIDKSEMDVPYGIVLGFNEKGRKVLKETDLKLYSNISPDDVKSSKDLELEVRSDDIYNIIMKKDMYKNSDYVCKPCKSNI